MALEWREESPRYLRLYDGDEYVAWLVRGPCDIHFSFLLCYPISGGMQTTDVATWDEAKALVVALYKLT